MSVYQVVTLPDPILRAKALPIQKINDGVIRVLDNMRDTMYAFDGVGLAAPQIGVSKRIVVIDTGENYIEIINPEIICKEGLMTGSEGCLSVPGIVGRVNRAKKVIVKGIDRQGQELNIEGVDLLAKALQHEIDHLDGILFIDIAVETRNDDRGY
ncbi:MAG: peptide deformylase [Syntrophomonadaceae bacterium]|nr:peptide deformylase [Syntrophomonadaceae bacterium]